MQGAISGSIMLVIVEMCDLRAGELRMSGSILINWVEVEESQIIVDKG